MYCPAKTFWLRRVMSAVIKDVRFTLRLMKKRPGVTALAVGALMLGIGLNTAIFSVLNAVLLRPVPLFEPDRVIRVYAKINQTGATLGISYPEYLDWKAQSHSFDSIAVMKALSFTMTGDGPPEHVKAGGISASGFRAWGIRTILGRDFAEEDDRQGANRVVILTYEFWQRKFGGDQGVIGKPLTMDDQTYSIVGVLQPTQIGVLKYFDLWVANGPQLDRHMMERDSRFYFSVARLKSNVSQVQAQNEMETIARRLAAEYPTSNKDMGIKFLSEVELLTADGRRPLTLLIVASMLIFLLAIVNVMTVFLGNTAERARELSVRLALGAGRSSLLRQLFVQSLMFAAIGGTLGLLLAKLVLIVFLHRFPDAFQRFQETTIDWRVISATLGLTLLASLIATLAPAIYALRLKINTEVRGENWFVLPKHRALGRGALILVEVAMASALSLVSGLSIKSLYEVEKVDLGFNPHRVLSFQINPPASRYKEPEKQSALYKLALEKLAHLPGMELTSGISGLPLTTQGDATMLEVDRQSPLHAEHLRIEDESVLPGFFQTMRLPLLEGRDFTDADREGAAPVVIVDDVLAFKLWPGQRAVGKRVRLMDAPNPRWLEVVGVVREIKHFGGPEAKVRFMQVYLPQYQSPTPMLSFVINTTLAEGAVKAAATKALGEVDKELPVEEFQTMDAYLDTFYSARKVSLLMLSTFAGTGIVLGMIGVFGVVSSFVIRRRREIAVRMALGATRREAIILVTRLVLLATLAGIVVGSGVVIALTRVLASFLFGISALYPAVYLVSAIILIVLAALASLVPALRLFRFNIQEILRQ